MPLSKNMPLGNNIRLRRSAQGLSLEALSECCGVSRAMLSEVERSRKSPTIHVLCQIASGLKCTVSELLEEAPPSPFQIVRAAQRPTVRDPDSGVERQILSTSLMRYGLEAVLYVLPPGTFAGPFDSTMLGRVEHITVISGRLTFVYEKREEVLGTGDSVTYGPAENVRYLNAYRKTCKLFLILDKSHLGHPDRAEDLPRLAKTKGTKRIAIRTNS